MCARRSDLRQLRERRLDGRGHRLTSKVSVRFLETYLSIAYCLLGHTEMNIVHQFCKSQSLAEMPNKSASKLSNWFILPKHRSSNCASDLNRSVVRPSRENLFHERHQYRKIHRLQEKTSNS